MYCWRCGASLEPDGQTLICRTGDMPLSRQLFKAMIERFPGHPGQLAQAPSRFGAGDPWFCPGCGVRHNSEGGCTKCGKSLTEFSRRRAASRDPSSKRTTNCSKSDIRKCSKESAYWLKGFLAGNEPEPPRDESGNFLDIASPGFKAWEREARHFQKKGIWRFHR